jgi:hypothetical protein
MLFCLQYKASATAEAGHCNTTLTLHAAPPWRVGLQLLGAPATHTLLEAAAPAAKASGASGSDGGGEVPLLDPLQQQQRQQQQSPQRPQRVPSGKSSPAHMPSLAGTPTKEASFISDAALDLPTALLRSLPPRLVAAAGQRGTAVVQLQSLAPCALDLLGLELQAVAGLQAVPVLPAAEQVDCGSESPSPAAQDTMHRTDIHTALYSLSIPGSGAPTKLPSMGVLRLRWRRHQRAALLSAADASGASHLDPEVAKAALAELAGAPPSSHDAANPADGDTEATGVASSGPGPACEVLVPLPPLTVLRPLLTAVMQHPPIATAGQPAVLQLELSSGGAASQEVAVEVGDPHGFLLAGELLLLPVPWVLGSPG